MSTRPPTAFVRRALNAGRLPPKDAVRVEELINYFPYDYPLPSARRRRSSRPSRCCPRRGTRPTSSCISASRATTSQRGRAAARQPRVPDRHLGLDGARGPAAAAQERFRMLARHAAARRHVSASSPMRARRGVALEPTKVAEKAQDRRGDRAAARRAARRRGRRASRRPTSWPSAASTRRPSTASSSPPTATSMSASPTRTSSRASSSASAKPASSCRCSASAAATTTTR